MELQVTAGPNEPDRHMTAPTPTVWLSDTALLSYIALATVILHLVLGNRYGIHRDELATLEDARHLAWGYPAYPPVTPFLGRISLELFGTSIRGFRFFAGLAQAIAVVLTGLMARDMGGRRGAQLIAAVAAVPFLPGRWIRDAVRGLSIAWPGSRRRTLSFGCLYPATRDGG
jgi:hypothetical protein